MSAPARIPNAFARSRYGLYRPPHAIDYTGQTFGDLTAVRRGSQGYWVFRCAQSHECLKMARTLRDNARQGKPPRCPTCKRGTEHPSENRHRNTR